MGPDLSTYDVIFQKKTYFQKRKIFIEGARAVSVYFSDPSQTIELLDSVGVDLDYPRPDLSICEVII